MGSAQYSFPLSDWPPATGQASRQLRPHQQLDLMRFFPRLQLLFALASLAFLSTGQDPIETVSSQTGALVPANLASTSNLSEANESSEADPTNIAEQIDALLNAHQKIDQMSGTVLVADKGEVVYRGAVGMANSDWSIPNDLNTKFRLASVTKQFTSMLVMLLVRDGKIDLGAPLTKYLPNYPAESGDRVTIHQLLNHTSGIPSYTDRPEFMHMESKGHYTVEAFLVEFCSDPLEFDPGTQFSYNNSGYFILGAIVEAVTQTTYQNALRERILEPLEMHDTGYDDQYAVTAHRATGYTEILGGRRVATWMDMTTPYAAGALYSTVDDLWKWDQALRAKRLLDGELEQLMFTPGLENYGFGWDIVDSEDDENGSPRGPVISHSGGMPGVSTLIWRMPSIGRCVIILSNSGNANPGAIKNGITEILDGREPKIPLPRGDYVVARRVLDEGIEAGLVELARWPQVIRDEYIERDVNAIAYNLLEQERYAEAIQLFEFLVATYPTSANAWDSLGEGHLLAGHRELAIMNYKKSLELDPESATIPGILKRLGRP